MANFVEGDKVRVVKANSMLNGRSGIVDCQVDGIVHLFLGKDLVFLNKKYVKRK